MGVGDRGTTEPCLFNRNNPGGGGGGGLVPGCVLNWVAMGVYHPEVFNIEPLFRGTVDIQNDTLF